MDDFKKALHEHNQMAALYAVYRFEMDVGISHIVDVVGSGAQAMIECDRRNERFGKALNVYQWERLYDVDPYGKYIPTTELTVLKECRMESIRALRRPQWLRKLVERLDSWFVR